MSANIGTTGPRPGILIVDVKEASRIPAFAEPWFLSFNVGDELRPAMIADLAASGMDWAKQSVGMRRGAGQLKRADGIVGPFLAFSHHEGAVIPSRIRSCIP